MWAGYLGSVSYVDYLVGRILSALYQENLFDNTLIIFTSDHGELLGSHGLMRKGAAMFEELVRIPLIIAPPEGRVNPGTCPELVSHVDLMPTILEYCGAETPAGLHGVSISSLIEGNEHPIRTGIAGEFHSCNWAESPPIPLRMWRTADAKYVESQQGDSEFYHLAEDPGERKNLIDDPASQVRIGEMKSALSEWLKETGDPWPVIVQPPTGFLKTRKK